MSPGGKRERPSLALMILSWAWVGVPFAYGLYELLRKATRLFTG